MALLEAGVRKFKCATPKEARVLLKDVEAQGVEGTELLVAYPHVEPNLTILANLAAEFPSSKLSVLVEDVGGVASVGGRLGLFVDVNVGMNRTGIPIAYSDQIMATVAAASQCGKLRGLHCYDGHLTMPDETARDQAAVACYDRAVETALAAIEVAKANSNGDSGNGITEVITSGSTTFLNALSYNWAALDRVGVNHTVSPGTIVFHDARVSLELN